MDSISFSLTDHCYIEGIIGNIEDAEFQDEITNNLGEKFLRYLEAKSMRNTISVISNISVSEAMRGEGLGKAILVEYVRKMKKINIDQIYLQVDLMESQVQGFSLIKFYELNGFEIIFDNIMQLKN